MKPCKKKLRDFRNSFTMCTQSSLITFHWPPNFVLERWKRTVGESDDQAELKKEREERESFEDEATMKIKKLEHDNETLEAEIDTVKAEERDMLNYQSRFSVVNYIAFGKDSKSMMHSTWPSRKSATKWKKNLLKHCVRLKRCRIPSPQSKLGNSNQWCTNKKDIQRKISKDISFRTA